MVPKTIRPFFYIRPTPPGGMDIVPFRRPLMRLSSSLLALIAVLSVSATPVMAKPACKGADGYAADFGGRPTHLWRADALARVKAQITKDPASVPAYAAVITDADAALGKGPWSVVDKTKTPPSGDKHDYMSIAPYFWPDPAKADGLPYINRDGEINPERATQAYDRVRLGDMANAVEALGLAYYFTGKQAYADRAAVILRAWFLDPATRMNPNLNFAQGVPGKTPGRSFGIIDTAELLPVVEVIGLLTPSHALSASDLDGLHGWFGDLTTWLQTSDAGATENKADNNHSIWYDLQLSDYALFSGKTDVAKTVISSFPERRITPQLAADGSLPRELGRTRSFHYSTWTMQAVYDITTLGECVGVDLWSYSDATGKGLRPATTFIASYAGREKDWKWQEISMNTEDLYDALLRAANGYGDPALSDKAAIYSKTYATSRINLTTPLLTGTH